MDIQFFILIYFLITFHPLSTQTLSVTIGDIVAHDHSNINGYNSPWLHDLGFRLGAFHNYSLVVFTLKKTSLSVVF